MLNAIRSDQLVKKLFEISDDTPDEVFDMDVLPAVVQDYLAQQQQQAPQAGQGASPMMPGGGL